MTNEERYVVNPLIRWFKRQKPTWQCQKPKHGTSSTGWDIEACRRNYHLLIEAKFIKRSFVSMFNGLVTAPLVKRHQKSMRRKYRSWCSYVCWAVSIDKNDKRNMYQMFFDYLAREPEFWKHYGEDLRLKYIFFVKDAKVAKVPFLKFVNAAIEYRQKKAPEKQLEEKRVIADQLMTRYKYS